MRISCKAVWPRANPGGVRGLMLDPGCLMRISRIQHRNSDSRKARQEAPRVKGGGTFLSPSTPKGAPGTFYANSVELQSPVSRSAHWVTVERHQRCQLGIDFSEEHRGHKPASSIQHPASSIQHPASSIQHPASSIMHPASSIQHPASSIQHPASSIMHPASSIQHPASSIMHPASSIQHPASCIKYPESRLAIADGTSSRALGRDRNWG